jgi:hypothetical protein
MSESVSRKLDHSASENMLSVQFVVQRVGILHKEISNVKTYKPNFWLISLDERIHEWRDWISILCVLCDKKA